jgi:hypothetical protein
MNTFSFSMDRGSLAVTAAMLVLLLCIKPGYADDVEFRWAILADSSDGMQSLDFSGSPIVFSGTALQIYIEHLNNCHIYLYLLDSNDEMTPLYPSESGYYDYGFPRGPKLVPPGEQSFMFVPPAGIETLLLIASVERLFQLEELTSIFLANPDSLGQQKLLLDRINALIKDGDEKKSKKAERLKEVTINYTSDSGIQEREFVATEVDTKAFYGRILLIDHR